MFRTQIVALITAFGLLLIVLELVRRRRLREEYSWLWLFAAVVYFLFSLWPNLARWLARLIGTENTSLAFIFLGMFFLIIILIQYSVRLSQLTTQVKDLTQQIAILDSEQRSLGEAVQVENAEQDTKLRQFRKAEAVGLSQDKTSNREVGSLTQSFE